MTSEKRSPLIFCWVILLVGFTQVTATEFGGGIGGSDSPVTNVLAALSGKPGFRWMRSSSRHVPAYGFAGIADVRMLVPDTDKSSDTLPDDLFQTYWMCRDGLSEFPGAPSVWEVWNEPDFYFVRNSAADMAATLKAAWWGLKAGRPDLQVLMPSLAFRPGRYALELAINGLASWTDGWNVHFYGWSADYSAFLAHHRAFARALGFEKPVWVTEIGHLGMPLTMTEDPSAQSAQATFHERTMIESWAWGVDRHLLFLLTPFAEGRSELGLTTADGALRPAMVSAIQTARALQGTRPVYRIIHQPSGAEVGVVLLRDTGRWWTILWSPVRPGEVALPGVVSRGSLDKILRVRPIWPGDWKEIGVGIDGEVALAPGQLPEFHLSSEANIHLHTPASRFGLSDCRWVGWTEDGGPAPRITRAARNALKAVPPLRKPSPVVVRFRTDAPVVADKPAQVLKVPAGEGGSGFLEFFNFSEEPLRGVCTLMSPSNWLVSAEGCGGEIEIPAMSRRDMRVRFRPGEDDGRGPEEPGRFVARWEGMDGSVDESSVRMIAIRSTRQSWYRWDWRDIAGSPGRPGGWQPFVASEDSFTIEVRSPWGSNREVAIHLPLPLGLKPTDKFQVGLRHVSGRGSPHAQLEMATREGETWRYGELITLERSLARLEANLGDFGPAIWGPPRTLLFPPTRKARWLSLQIQGVLAGDVLEVTAPSIFR